MNWLTLIFPIAAVGFLILIFSEYLPVMCAPELPLRSDTDGSKRMDAKDRAAVLIISLAYAAVAFTNLGINTAPQSFCRFEEKGQYALIELNESTEIGAVMYYAGLYSGTYRLQFSPDGEDWTDQQSMEQEHGDLFKWQYAELNEDNGTVKFIRIIAGSRLWLGELALYDASGALIGANSLSYDAGCAKLFDEQDTVPDAPSYLNSAYFDEIYHARTAFENVENIYPYEVSHPPLGKLIISLGVRIFGMTPFGWRFMGTLFGVLMLPVVYVFLKKLFGGRAVPVCCTLIFAFDFMHFTQTRIATIDTYAVFFILLMYLFMYMYLTADRDGRGLAAIAECEDENEKVPRRNWLPYLALPGLFFGLGAASKWTCIYAGAGLGVLWLGDRIYRGVKMCRAGRKWYYIRETSENILWCLLFFVLVPCAVYYASYYPYGKASGMSGLSMYFTRDYLDIVLKNQEFMFTYHSGVTASHPYSSRWYQWILDIRPILYYLKYFDDGTKSSFGAFVSPLLCWGGLLSMLAMGYMAIRRRDGKAAFILIGYLAQLLPWVLITRVTFEYHYFPSTVFLVLAMGHVFTDVKAYSPHWKRVVFSFTAVSVGLFAVFYPVLSGLRVPQWYSHELLCWIPGWWPF